MHRVGFAILAILVAVVLLLGAAYEAGLLARYVTRAITHVRPGVITVISMMISLGSMYFCIWIGLRHRSRDQ